jgi:hypothetical protein
MIELTPMLIETLRTPAGGFNKAAMEELDIPWPLERGWIVKASGRTVSDRKWKAAVKAAKRGPIYMRRGNTRGRR